MRQYQTCQTCLATLTTDIYNALQSHSAVLLCKLDIAKAFDTLPPQLVVKELQNCGAGSETCRLIANYLSGRSFRVKCGSQLTTPRNVYRGVPQGSALGPLLYILATRGVTQLGLTGKLHIYADDIVLTYGHSPGGTDEARRNMVHDLGVLDRWFATQGMALQHQKTQFFAVAPLGVFKRIAAQPITHNGCSSTITNTMTVLGITLDAQLTFKAQVRSVLRKIANYSTPFRRLARFLSLKEKRRLIGMCLYSILDYGIGTWVPLLSADQKAIYRKVNKLIRILLHLHPRTRMTPVYLKLGLRKPDDHMALRVAEHTALRVRKGDFPLKLETTTRSDRHFFCKVNNIRKCCARRTPDFRDVAWWNSLPPTLREINTLCDTCGVVCYHFRRCLKQYALGSHHADYLRTV